ncbi:MAG: hypothetical protein IAG13_36150 [Deltaproteobacteria bacterium]|nr:hypothetical protein [Nannocystaceae bacterium]
MWRARVGGSSRFDQANPCLGFYCGGDGRGTCTPADGRPTCECSEGFDNEKFALYCCPADGSDPACVG